MLQHNDCAVSNTLALDSLGSFLGRLHSPVVHLNLNPNIFCIQTGPNPDRVARALNSRIGHLSKKVPVNHEDWAGATG